MYRQSEKIVKHQYLLHTYSDRSCVRAPIASVYISARRDHVDVVYSAIDDVILRDALATTSLRRRNVKSPFKTLNPIFSKTGR